MAATMTGKITKIQRQRSRDGGGMWFICFKMDDGMSARSYVYEKNGNFRRWMPCIKPFQDALAAGREVWLGGLRFWSDPKKRMVDADSTFEVLKQPTKEGVSNGV